MAFTVEHVKSLLPRNLVNELEKVRINIVAKIKQVPCLSQSKLYEHLTVLKTVRRDLLVERDIPDGYSQKVRGKIIIFYIIYWKMNPPRKATISENTIFKGKLSSLDSSSAVYENRLLVRLKGVWFYHIYKSKVVVL